MNTNNLVYSVFLVLTILSSYTIFLIGLLLMIKSKLSNKFPIIFFLICLLLYLNIHFFEDTKYIIYVLVGPFLLPYSLYIFTKSIFSDRPINIYKFALIAIIVLIISYLTRYFEHEGFYPAINSLIQKIVSFLFVALIISEVQSGKREDLIHKRRRMRLFFIYGVVILVVITLLSELGLDSDSQDRLQVMQRIAILLLSIYFICKSVQWDNFLVFPQAKSSLPKDLELIDEIQKTMLEDKFFTTENLTVKKLSEVLGEQEYVVRRVINQQLNYRNFSDFLNSYRLAEAKKILKDPSQKRKTVLEIAYEVGFNSIGPFNRAFKLSTGLTPTEFRKKHH